jgi:DNA repair exonuclease SbcCD ATPase subunit
MITIKNITIKNFLSVGQVTQSINLEHRDLVLVLGENLDLGGNDARNGVGKSTIVNALSYALYGVALTNIKKDNLINKTNGKNMLVTLDFEKDGITYRVERGRRPGRFVFSVAGKEFQSDDSDEAQGDSRVTQQELERHLGIGHTMFKMIVALNTYSEPFLSMRAGEQRAIIEQLLGITQLSEKAEVLKVQLRETKDAIKEEEFRITAVKEANRRIEDNIKSLRTKSAAWLRNHEKLLEETAEAIIVLQNIEIEDEIAAHKVKTEALAAQAERDGYDRSLRRHETALSRVMKNLTSAETDLAAVMEQACPTCGHELDDEKHQTIELALQGRILALKVEIAEHEAEIAEAIAHRDAIAVTDIPQTFYDDIEEAYNHRASLDGLMSTLETESVRENPYVEQIRTMEETGLQEVSFDKINELSVMRDHQDFLFKLLTSKDSFIRRKIIDQNLAFLNARLEAYLDKIGLPHSVLFQSDLNVEIQEHGRDLDFDNLSRGERTRLILSLSWAFRDVYESLNTPISLLFIDELIDSGLDSAGVESSLSVLKKMARDSKKNIFLISHRDELVGRVNSVLRVVKEGGFTSFQDEDE